MREFMINFFSNDKIGPEITLFGLWHIIYLVIIYAAVFLTCYLIRNKDKEFKSKVVNIFAIVLLVLYISDFFF